ncbi:MAG: hypothetical protein EHM79_15885 [Geobacter sp.]|nr:MAG: hypothetical protein EHM79_15885 [Geobacter sp.]
MAIAYSAGHDKDSFHDVSFFPLGETNLIWGITEEGANEKVFILRLPWEFGEKLGPLLAAEEAAGFVVHQIFMFLAATNDSSIISCLRAIIFKIDKFSNNPQTANPLLHLP